MKKILTISTILLILSGCGPVKIEGDVFLVKGDGKPQPSAAKEVIFVNAESFEDILIESYLESVESDLESNAQITKGICENASSSIISERQEIEMFLNENLTDQKANNVTDLDGTCITFKNQSDEATLLAVSSRNNFDELIAKEEVKKTNAEAEVKNLKSRLEQNIASSEEAMYNDFIKDIEIILLSKPKDRYSYGDQSSYVSVVNNTQYNIKADGDMCFQFFNAEGKKRGHTSTAGSLGECSSYFPEYRADGTIFRASNTIMNVSEDEFGFSKGGYLSPGQTSGSRETSEKSYFCSASLSPSETLRLSRKYGDDKASWPDLSKPDLSKGYTKLEADASRVNAYGGDKKACGLDKVQARFVPLEDEIRLEKGDQITYVSKEISFRAIAEAETHKERGLISEQEEIIRIAEAEIERITSLSLEDLFLKKETIAKSDLDHCSSAIESNNSEQQFIDTLAGYLEYTAQCNFNDNDLLDTLFSISLSDKDTNQLEKLVDKDYSVKASYTALKKFSDSEYKSSTNISGHYVLNEIPKGNYVVYSSYQDNFIEGIYLDNIEITGEAQIDLSNIKFLEVGNLSNVIETYYQDCSGAICEESDLRYTLDFNEAEKIYKNRKEAQEDLRESLRELERLLGN